MGFRNGADCSLRNESGPVRQKEREGKRGRKRERCHSYLPPSLSLFLLFPSLFGMSADLG
jgi:hypothetical protein